MNLSQNDKLLDKFEKNINEKITQFQKKIFKMHHRVKRLNFESNLDMCASFYRQKKFDRLIELISQDKCRKNENLWTISDNEDVSEGYFTSDTSSPKKNPSSLKENSIVPIITIHKISEFDQAQPLECKVTLIWNIFDLSEKKFVPSESSIIKDIKLYEIYSSCIDSLDNEDLHFKKLEKKNIDKSSDWEIIGTVEIFEPPVKWYYKKY